MAKIQGVKAVVNVPTALNQPVYPAGTYDPIARGVSHLGEALYDAGRTLEDKKRKAEITNMDSEFRAWSLDRFTNDQRTRQGKAALGDDENPDVFRSYDDEATKRVGEMVAKLPERYQAEAKARFQSVADGYRDRYAGYLTSQIEAHRKSTIASSVDVTNTELANDIQAPGAGIPEIQKAVASIKGALEINSGGRDTTAEAAEYSGRVINQAIIAKAAVDPKGAKQLLGDKAVTDYLDASQIETLKKHIEEERIDQSSKALVASVAALPYEEQARKIAAEKDPKVASRALQEVNFRKNALEAAENEEQSKRLDAIHDQIFVTKNPPTPLEIDEDPTLTPGQMETAKNWLGLDTTKAGQMTEKDRQAAYLIAVDKIRRKLPGWTRTADIMQAAGSEFDVRDMKALVGEYEDELEGKGITSRVSLEVDALYPDLEKSERAGAILDVSRNLRQKREQTSLPASPAEVETAIRDALDPLRKRKFSEYVPFVPRGKESKPQASFVRADADEQPVPFKHREIVRKAQEGGKIVSYPDAMLGYYSKLGYTEPFHVNEDGVDFFVLGEKNGKYGYDAGNGPMWLDPDVPDEAAQIEAFKKLRGK